MGRGFMFWTFNNWLKGVEFRSDEQTMVFGHGVLGSDINQNKTKIKEIEIETEMK